MYTFLKQAQKASWTRTVVLMGIILFSILVGYFIASSQDYYKAEGKDFISLWLAPRLLLEGKDPYSPQDWIPAHTEYGAQWVSDATFLYPLSLAVILLPLGLLPLEYASVLWIALSILVILFVFRIFLIIGRRNWINSYDIPALIGILSFRPVAVTLWLGQLDWLILLFLGVGAWCWEKRKWCIGAMIMALSVIKPQLGLPLLAFVSIWSIFHRRWIVLIGQGITIGGLFILGWLFDHTWLSSWIGIGGQKVESFYCCTPTLWGMSSLSCGFNLNCALNIGRIIAIVVFILMLIFLARLREAEPEFVIGFSIPVALIISPYLWTYSQIILVIPILLGLELVRKKQWPYLLVAPFTLYFALFSSLIVLLSIKIGVDVLSALVPIAVFVILWVLYRLSDHGTKKITKGLEPIQE